jgi:hypothetical protein
VRVERGRAERVPQPGADPLDVAALGGRERCPDGARDLREPGHGRGGPQPVQAVLKQITLSGMQVGSYLPQLGMYAARAAGRLADGSLRTRETVYEGLDEAPGALLGVLTGAGVGKVLVRLGG